MPVSDEQADLALTNRFAAAKFGWEPRWYNPSLERWLHRISVATLVLWGQNDKLFPSEYATRWGERIPGQPGRDHPGLRPWHRHREAGARRQGNHAPDRGDTLMQFTFFHLMPYRPLDMAERAQASRRLGGAAEHACTIRRRAPTSTSPTSSSWSTPKSSAST